MSTSKTIFQFKRWDQIAIGFKMKYADISELMYINWKIITYPLGENNLTARVPSIADNVYSLTDVNPLFSSKKALDEYEADKATGDKTGKTGKTGGK